MQICLSPPSLFKRFIKIWNAYAEHLKDVGLISASNWEEFGLRLWPQYPSLRPATAVLHLRLVPIHPLFGHTKIPFIFYFMPLLLNPNTVLCNGRELILEAQIQKGASNCLGALDGTHVEVSVSLKDQGRYRNGKGRITTNVLAVCSHDLRFTYILPGWEGSAAVSRVLRDALTRNDPFIVPKDKYFMVDAGYTNGPGFLAPYRGIRYHLNEWSTRGNNPQNPKELYNPRHATARNVI